MNREIAVLAERLTREYEEAEAEYRSAQARLRDVQAEIARVREAAKTLDEPDPFAKALQARRETTAVTTRKAAARKPQLKAKNTPRARAEAIFGK